MSCLAQPAMEAELGRIRELSREGRFEEALMAAEALARDFPQSRDALYLTAVNQRCLNRIPEALATLSLLEQHHPHYSLLYQERGYGCVALRNGESAIEAFERAVNLNPALEASWTMLGRLYRLSGKAEQAAKAAAEVVRMERLPEDLVRAAKLVCDGERVLAEDAVQKYLQEAGTDVEALRWLIEIEIRVGALAEAERLLARVMEFAPGDRGLRLDQARVLVERQKYAAAQEAVKALLELEPEDRDCLSLLASSCAGLGDSEGAIDLYRRLLESSGERWDLRMGLGHSLQSVGRREEAIECFRAALAARPELGDAWWSLANLKSYRFSDAEIAQMRRTEAARETSAVDRGALCFALAKAYEDGGEFALSWQFYERGNALKRAESRSNPVSVEEETRRQIEVFTERFFAEREGWGAGERDAIFIVGLPRSGSTLIEQILASHSQVEGTQELPAIPRMVQELENPGSGEIYPEPLASMGREQFRQMGERYLSEARAYRRGKRFFIDKMPNNFRYIGFLHLILPNAKIIDVRREPMACCLSNLKQLYARGQEFSYGIQEVAGYYRAYLELMRHWDRVLPGRVLRIRYEDVVENLEEKVRRILAFSGLDFEPGCGEFHKTARSIRTPSSEQVRRPIYRDGLSQWRNYERWLDPLEEALGDALVRYRE